MSIGTEIDARQFFDTSVTEWMEEARCLDADPDIFFPEKGGSTRNAQRICSVCDVREQCLEYAIEYDQQFGIWGGKSEREVRALRSHAQVA